jgi:hypothetical protein
MGRTVVVSLTLALAAISPTVAVGAEGTVSTYLRDEWEIKAAS